MIIFINATPYLLSAFYSYADYGISTEIKKKNQSEDSPTETAD